MEREIITEKPFWQTADKRNVDDFIKLIDEWSLDPVKLNYGKYAQVVQPYQYHPDHRPDKTVLYLHTGFASLHWVFDDEEISKEDWLKAKKAVNHHMKSERFQRELHNHFNAVTLEKTMILNREGIKEFRDDNWFLDTMSNILFPIDNWWCPEFKAEWKRLDVNHKPELIECVYVDVQFVEKHWSCQEEYEELKSLIVAKNGSDPYGNIRMTQAKRFTGTEELPYNFKDYKDVTLRSTGRRLKYDPDSYYCFNWYEIDPVITKPTKNNY